MGRDKKSEGRGGHFASMKRAIMETEAWRSLPPVAQALYPWLLLEWRGPGNNNNGRISLSVRQAAERIGVSKDTASKAFRDLQSRGFIFCTKPPEIGLSGVASCPMYEITEIALPTAETNQGRRLYKDWRRGNDQPVVRAPTHNPSGSNGKAKPRHKS